MSFLTTMSRDFHRKHGIPINKLPGFPSESRRSLRRNLLMEEVTELVNAEFENNFLEVADAVGDIILVLAGTCDEYGIPLDRVLDEIHKSNMTKEGGDGTGKIRKGESYVAPDMRKVLYGDD